MTPKAPSPSVQDRLQALVRETRHWPDTDETLSPELQREREEVDRRCINGARVSPEALIGEALEGKIGFLDLYTFFTYDTNPKLRRYVDKNPGSKMVCVGLEFMDNGVKFQNIYQINYEALLLIKKVADESVEIVNIDFPLNDSFLEQLPQQKELDFLEQAHRVLEEGGILNMFIDARCDEDFFRVVAQNIGFTEVTFFLSHEWFQRYSDYRGRIKAVTLKK